MVVDKDNNGKRKEREKKVVFNSLKDYQGNYSLNYELPLRQKLLRRHVRRFAEKILGPVAPIVDKESKFSWETAAELSKINAWGIQIPEKYGGAEMDAISYAIIIEEISRVCASTGLNVSAHNSLASYPIVKWGNEEQKERFLYDLASGNKLGGFALTEPDVGSDPRGMASTAVQDGDDFILNGSKTFITNGAVGSVFITIANYNSSKGEKGIGAFIVEREMKGFETLNIGKKMCIRGSSTTSLHFTDVRIPSGNILGKLNDGFKIAMQILDVGRIGIAAQSLGIAQAAYEYSIKHVKNRVKIKKLISDCQGVTFKLAEMATRIEAARGLTYKAAFMKDHKQRISKESAMCKYYASLIADQITNEALQLHGRYGYLKGFPVERYFRDARALQIYEGTNEIMKLIIAQQILKGNI